MRKINKPHLLICPLIQVSDLTQTFQTSDISDFKSEFEALPAEYKQKVECNA
jgi:hypothetical protein